ncbi:hypothetical protein Clacol_002252 [Clathrus columnatus]|uniref:Terpene synthase n=1 Tax=Clathrus columnatus TaxID=1419009 RepID=A0AAV5A4V7_9AGAM|nr:hypothetical protein Clacol_002252 [Clathrus columnatus]
MNLFFVIDEHTDGENASTVRTRVDIIMDAIRNPNIPPPNNGEWVGGEIARQFWENAIHRVSPVVQTRFINEFQAYLNAVVDEAADRESRYIRNIEDYFKIRRNTIGAKPSFAICEMYMNIPEEVMRHPVIKKLRELAIDTIIIGNDLYSYNVEQARGDSAHNFVTIVMHEFKFDIQSAINWIVELHENRVTEFLQEYYNMQPLGSFESDVIAYCRGSANWVRANDSWSSEILRYDFNESLLIGTDFRKPKHTPARDMNILFVIDEHMAIADADTIKVVTDVICNPLF